MDRINNSGKNWWYTILLLLVFAAGLGIRLFDLDNPPLDFHPARQFHSAILARGFYTQMQPNLPDFERSRYLAEGLSELWIEPPILEGLTALTCRLVGGDIFWIARFYSIMAWLIGGFGLYLLAKRVSGKGGAFFSLLFYLFLPYGITASRSFQPDPLMVCLTIWAVWALATWTRETGWQKTITTGLLMGVAILVKQVAVFFLLGALIARVLSIRDLKKTFTDRKIWLMISMVFLPVLLYNFWGVYLDGFLIQQYGGRLYPEFWQDLGFYLRWLVEIDDTVGFYSLIVGLVGIILLWDHRDRNIIIGYFCGYIVYGFVFAHHISTHNYYQLPLIPFITLAIAPLADIVVRRVLEIKPRRWFILFFILILMGVSFTLWRVETRMKRENFRAEPAKWSQLGKKMGYENSNVMGLFNDYGVSLMYWGLTTPVVWPNSSDQEMTNFKVDVGKIMDQLSGKYYFIVTDFVDFDKQVLLKQTLVDNYPVLEKGDGYLIFDLREPIK